jgi:hypothetical protein
MVAGLSAGGAQAWAIDASDFLVYNVGSLQVKPRAAMSEQYDDNIFLSASTPTNGLRAVESDFLTVISPGVTLQLGRKESNHLIFDYGLDQTFYASHGTEDHRDHILSLETKITRSRITVDGRTSVLFLTGVLSGPYNQPGQRVDRAVYLNNYRLEYAISDKTSAYAVGSFNATDYAQGISLYDDNDLRGTGGFAYKITPKTSLVGELYYGQSAVSANEGSLLADSPYSFVYGGFVGANGDFTTRLKGSVKVGYEAREFGQNNPGSTSPVVEASLTGNLTKWTEVSLSYSRRSEVSAQAANQAYTADSISARLNQFLTTDGKWTANIGGTFVNSDYADNGSYAQRHDVEVRANVGVVYRFQPWLLTQLSYEFQKFNSNQYFDYVDNRVTLRLSVGY